MIAAAFSYTRTNAGGVRPKQYRPKTVGEARKLIFETFSRQREDGWDSRDVQIFLESKGIAASSVEELNSEQVRTLINAMERGRMIIFAN